MSHLDRHVEYLLRQRAILLDVVKVQDQQRPQGVQRRCLREPAPPPTSIPTLPPPRRAKHAPRHVQNLHRRAQVHPDRPFLDGRHSSSAWIRRAPVSLPARDGKKQGGEERFAASSRTVVSAVAFAERRDVDDGKEEDRLGEELLKEHVQLRSMRSARFDCQTAKVLTSTRRGRMLRIWSSV